MSRRRRTANEDRDSGVTFIELLIVLVIIPMVIGAIAFVFVATNDSSGTTQSRLADSVNAQQTATYFPRDAGGAEYVTTLSSAGTQPGLTSGGVCGSGSSGASANTLLVALYRPANAADATAGTPASSGYSVAYWRVAVTSGTGVTKFEVLRDVCSVTTTTASTTVSTSQLMSDDVNSQLSAQITPNSPFGTSAATQWTPTQSITTTTAQVNLLTYAGVYNGHSYSFNGTLPVDSTAGFTTGSSFVIYVGTSSGVQSLTCTGTTTTATGTNGPGFTGCGTANGGTSAGASVTQPTAVADVRLSVTQPGTAYTFSVAGTPRAFSNAQYGSASPGGQPGPPLIFLGNSGQAFSWNGNASVDVNGVVGLNGNSISCSSGNGNGNGGSESIIGSGFETNGGTIGSCATGGPTSPGSTSDPIAPFLPGGGTGSAAYPVSGSTAPYFHSQTPTYSTSQGSTCSPGEYLNATAFNNCRTLHAGVYVLDGGANLGTCNACVLTLASGDSGGVLLYIPCNTSPCTASWSGGFSALPGLSAAQSVATFGTSALANLLIWQNISDTASGTIWGSGSATSQNGIIYMPGAPVSTGGTGCLEAAQVIVYSLSITGGGNGNNCGGYDVNVTG